MQRIAAFLFFSCLTSAVASQVVINEVGIAPASGAGSQFTELFNRSGCAIDLSCYTLVFSSTSGGGNPTGWTIKIPSGKSVAAGGYFVIGGTAGSAGVTGGTGYPTGGVVNSFTGTADVDVGTTQMTANAVYMKQFLSAGSFSNTKGQLTLLDANGNVAASVSYNNGNTTGSYPLSAYTSCNLSGNGQGLNNIPNPGPSAANVNATFSAATVQGIYVNSSGAYAIETSLTPGTSNAGNGGSQLCSGPVLNTVSNAALCISGNNQNVSLSYSTSNAPTSYSFNWTAAAAVYFTAVSNATLGANISILVPANTPAGTYNGFLTLANGCGNSCAKPFTITINSLPVVSSGAYAPMCVTSPPLALNGSPSGGLFSGIGVSGTSFAPPSAGSYTISYAYTDAITGCTNNASSAIAVSAPTTTYATACTNTTPYTFFGQPLTSTGLHTVLVNNANGCTDTARLYLVVKQTLNIDTAACDSLLYNGAMQYGDANFTQVITSSVTACDSVVKNILLHVKKSTVKDTTVCLPANGSFTALGQTITASGNYVLHTLNSQGCDSMLRLHVTVAAAQTQIHSGCDSVRVMGQTFYSSTAFTDTLRNTNGCDSLIRRHSVVVYHPSHTQLNACIGVGQTYFFNGQSLTASGNYTAVLNGLHCDSIVHLALLVAQFQTLVYRGCNGYVYNGVAYTSSTVLHDTLKSIATGCDSVLRTIRIIISPILHTFLNACIQQGGSYVFNNQTLATGGSYTAQLTAQGGCDSTVHLYLTVTASQTQYISGCDSLWWKGQLYYASTQLNDTVRSLVSGCDSIVRRTNLLIRYTAHNYLTACLKPGQTYSFNGQLLNATGNYQTTFSTSYCDSIVHLHLVMAQPLAIVLNDCRSVFYNGVVYTSSTVVRDTVKAFTNCDSLYREAQINIHPVPPTFINTCIAQGSNYFFNGQLLAATGHYRTTYQTPSGCDSVVNLYLLVSKIQRQTVSGCDTVIYKGSAYISSTVLSDTIKSELAGCDSIVTLTTIVVNNRPPLFISRDTAICKGGTATLRALSPTAVVNWTGISNANAIIVSPPITTQYTVTATDTNGCVSKATVSVLVQDFSLLLSVDKNPALSGTSIMIQSSSNSSYAVLSWQPASMFTNQGSKSQGLSIDTSINITAIAQSSAGCKDTAMLQLTAIPLDDIYIPSGFTPNGDGRNDDVKVMGTGIKELTFTVFNRWGQVVFHSTDKGKGWDGKFAGMLQAAGTYVYVARVKKASGQVVEKKGVVTLIR